MPLRHAIAMPYAAAFSPLMFRHIAPRRRHAAYAAAIVCLAADIFAYFAISPLRRRFQPLMPAATLRRAFVVDYADIALLPLDISMMPLRHLPPCYAITLDALIPPPLAMPPLRRARLYALYLFDYAIICRFHATASLFQMPLRRFSPPC